MNTSGIKISIYDFFSYFISGVMFIICIILSIYFTNNNLKIPFREILGDELLLIIPNWYLIIFVVITTYVFGIIISTLSSIIIENLIMKIPFLKNINSMNNIISEKLFILVCKKAKKDFDIDFSEKYLRLIITYIEKHSINAYNTALVFLTIYGMNRNLCIIFFPIGIITLIINIIQQDNVLFAFVLIGLSVLTFIGYIRFMKYFISQILSAYLTNEY